MMEKKSKSAEAQMLIRRNVEEVFNAFIDPEITKQFWFTKGSAPMELNKTVTWSWEMYNIAVQVVTRELVANKRIQFEWVEDNPTSVTIDFKELDSQSTFVSIVHGGFDKSGDDLLDAVKDSTGGFTIVLAGLKAFLEHNINLNLVADKFPKELADH